MLGTVVCVSDTFAPLPAALPFSQVDVFTAVPYLGNPVAVVHDAGPLEALGDQHLARFARWTNLSETTFLLPPTADGAAAGADYRLRIFTPAGELPFAGHPTLGSAHAWLEAGGTPRSGFMPDGAARLVQECGVGLVEVRRAADVTDAGAAGGAGGAGSPATHGPLAFAAPPLLVDEPLDDAALDSVVAALGVPREAVLEARVLDNGPGWRVVLLDSAERVLGLDPDRSKLDRTLVPAVGVVGLYPVEDPTHARNEGRTGAVGPDGADAEVRGFALDMGIPEDPVTGSLGAVIGQWLLGGRLPTEALVSQGTVLGRQGRVRLRRDCSETGDAETGDAEADGQVWVGGDTVTCIRGSVAVPPADRRVGG